jgi:hypothetical protein
LLDVRFFGGRFVFLIVANLVILCGIIAILIAYLRRLTSERRTQFVIGATICIMAMSWLHQFNLASGVSGAQYFMAIFLPLVAFYWLARAQEERYFFSLAVLAGFASAWTHGNGILVLPLLATFALCIGLKTARIVTLTIASVSTIALYFIARDEPAYWATLTGDPISAARFALGFLGNPFFYIVSYPLALLQYLIGAGQAARPMYGMNLSDYPIAIGFYIAQAAGVVLILTTGILAKRWFASGREATRGALLIFLFFIILTAAACAARSCWTRHARHGRQSESYPPVGGPHWVACLLLPSCASTIQPSAHQS